MRNVVLKNITDKADKLANEYNKTKDPGLRDQWYKLIKTVSQVPSVSEEARLPSRKKTLGKVRTFQSD
jgi:hypothetical protein